MTMSQEKRRALELQIMDRAEGRWWRAPFALMGDALLAFILYMLYRQGLRFLFGYAFDGSTDQIVILAITAAICLIGVSLTIYEFRTFQLKFKLVLC